MRHIACHKVVTEAVATTMADHFLDCFRPKWLFATFAENGPKLVFSSSY